MTRNFVQYFLNCIPIKQLIIINCLIVELVTMFFAGMLNCIGYMQIIQRVTSYGIMSFEKVSFLQKLPTIAHK